jgi:hypothetical protein
MRRAAARLREASANATPPPWRVAFLDGVAPLVDGPGHMVAKMHRCGHPEHEERAKADATLAALLRNASEPLAGWLELEAERAERTMIPHEDGLWCLWCGGVYGHNCACWDGALTVAREILGEAPGGQ